MADRVTIYDNLKERGLNFWDALSRSADEYFSSKPSFSPSQPFDMRYYVDGNYLPPLQDSVQRDVGNAVAKGVLDTVTDPVGYVQDLYYGIADPAVSAYKNTSASLPYYGNAALQRLQGDDNTEAMNIADKYSANAITSLGLLGLGIADVLPSGKVTKPVKGLLDDVDELGFYSPTERLAATLQPKGTGQQYLGILAKGDGKGSRIQEEMQDMGLDTWLKSKGKVSRDEVLDYIGENRLRYGEEVLTSKNPYPYRTGDEWQNAVMQANRRRDFDEVERLTSAWESSEGYGFAGDTKYQKYSQTGGTGYQENLLTVPDPERVKFDALQAERDKLSRMNLMDNYEGSGKSILDRIAEIDKEVGYEFKGAKQYNSPHYDPANIGLTTRTQSFNTPQGDSVHLMDELQSDWHKEGGKKGYKGDTKINPTIEARLRELEAKGARTTAQERQEYYSLVDELSVRDADEYVGKRSVPNAPAKQSWINQGIKKEINQTIADGRDYFAWTGGDIQADRYDLSKHVDKIDYVRNQDGTFNVVPSQGGQTIYAVQLENATIEKVESTFGKDIAKQMADEEIPVAYGFPIAQTKIKTIAGQDLKVGGEGMKSFYDKDVKKRTEKIIKRLDPNAKVEVIELDNGNKVWGVKITDKMRDKVKSEGMPLYSIAPIAGAGLLGAGMMRQEEQQPQQGILN